MSFIAEFRYNDRRVIRRLWDYACYVDDSIDNASLTDGATDLSVIIKIEDQAYIAFELLNLNNKVEIVDKIMVVTHKLTLSECSKLANNLIRCKPHFSQLQYKLSIGLSRVKEILNENKVSYSIRDRYKPDRFISAAKCEISDTEPLLLCHDSKYEDSIWISTYHEIETRLFFEPNKFRKDWKEILIRGISEVVANSYSAGLSLPN